MRVVLASANEGKAREFQQGLDGLVKLELISELVTAWGVEETGCTFYANALIKAEAAAKATGLPALADDSGLSVYYLGGEPGVHSSRFAGSSASDEENNQLLLKRMATARTRTEAHFSCVLCLKIPGQEPRFATGRLFGHILKNPRGEGGFGYDPLFQAYSSSRTLAEMSLKEKNEVSHRGLALRKMVTILGEVWRAR